jgi:hypothetical protein
MDDKIGKTVLITLALLGIALYADFKTWNT